MKKVQITARRAGEVTDEQYQHAINCIVLWVSQGKNPDDAAELAAHQLRLMAITNNREKEMKDAEVS